MSPASLKLPETGCDPGLPLAGYVQGAAIGNRRIVSIDGDQVTFTYKDYRDGGIEKQQTLSGEEFVRRFIIHILPPRFRRVRHRGFLSNRTRTEAIANIRQQLQVPDEPPVEASAESAWEGDADDQPLQPPRCPHCGAKEMVWERELLPKVGWIARRYSHFAMKVKGAGFGLDWFRQTPSRPP
jgi:hypothetical protein